MAEESGDAPGTPSARTIQDKVLEYWERTGVPGRALTAPEQGPTFRFTEGPPTANGAPHVGHLVARVFKDLQLRYRRMRGYRILTHKAGWDCHGLPVELEVEKRHRLHSRREIEAFGVTRFCDECRADTLRVAEVWREMSRRLGYWLDYDHAYRTMDAPFIESVWWSLKTLFDRGLLEKGHYVVPYCPRCETPLASHEVAQGYRDATDPSVTVRFPLVGEGAAGRDLLVWTTTPWTLPANLLLAVRPGLEYAVVRSDEGREFVLASAAVPRYFPTASVLERLPGESLVGRGYRPPFDAAGPGPGRYRVVAADFVTVEEGTGIVHVAPSFGPDDQKVGQREGVGSFDPLDSRGVFTDAVPLVAGQRFKAADPALVADLTARGLVVRSETLRHTYPFCWRCDTALLYRALDCWFVRTSRATGRLVENNRTVDWVPAHLRDGRFGNFLTEAKDWALSRNRYWGTPLPVWVCENGHPSCVGSFAELADRAGTPLPPGFEGHRLSVDGLVLACPTCHAPSRREPYTIDAWYDSGSAPFAQFHYPFEAGPFDPSAPLDHVAEGLDQTRGWFYALLVISTLLFDRPAYRSSLTTGLVLDESGRKMSKSRGNVLDPLELLERLGADPVRWTFLTIDFTEPMRIGESTILRAAGRTLGTLANVVTFHAQNARADRMAPATERPAAPSKIDRWILSRLEGTRAAVEEALETYDPRPAAAALRAFVEDLSTWYLRRSRPRFWGETGTSDRRAAHETLSWALQGLSELLAPIVPFTAEWISHEVGERPYLRLETSVHLRPWPTSLGTRDVALEEEMTEVRELVEVGRELRQRAGVKSRIPLEEMVEFAADPSRPPIDPELLRLAAEELNVRRVRTVPTTDRPRFGDAGWVVRETEGRPVAALPREPTPELLEEGRAREVARRLQQTRKDLGLEVTDHVEVTLGTTEPLLSAARRHLERLRKDLLAEELRLESAPLAPGDGVRDWEIDGVRLTARVAKRTT